MERVITELLSLVQTGHSVVTDTRKLERNGIFFALKGTNFNGNTFAEEALKGGCSQVVIDEEEFYHEQDSRYFLVPDALYTLQTLATAYRKSMENLHVIGVTGSNGKTTTKELIHSVLATKYKVHATPGNFNNHIGVPLTLLSMPTSTEIAIIELGDNHPDEIASLCKIALPDSGLLTNIGKDHIEGFGTLDANIQAKKELFDYLESNQKIVFLNGRDEQVNKLGKELKTETVVFNYNALQRSRNNTSPYVIIEDSDGNKYETHLLGLFNYPNLVCAYTVGKYFDVPNKDIFSALRNYQPKNNRSQLIKTASNRIFMDAYNANPSSVSLALDSFAILNTPLKKVCILGEMGELGSISEEEHLNTIKQVKTKAFDRSIFVGEKYKVLSQQFSHAEFYKSRTELEEHIKNNPITDSYILLKGSRSVALEKLLDIL